MDSVFLLVPCCDLTLIISLESMREVETDLVEESHDDKKGLFSLRAKV